MNTDFTFDDAAARALPRAARRLAPLPLADSRGAAGEHAWLRRRRPDAHQPGARRTEAGRAARAAIRRRARHGARARHRSQPHGHGARESLLGGRPRARRGVALRAVVRHRLEQRGAAAARQACSSPCSATSCEGHRAGRADGRPARGRRRRHYFENDFPLDPATWPVVLDARQAAAAGRGSDGAPCRRPRAAARGHAMH